eukprot:TRINITY_DN4385_c0_g1_i2.p1 TRINITY_DN4385_c0_g1~~TRINITY_DN4385_c0_g1_i2.p1  ORF type:complete len:1123 (-),score=135.87 TRINITY_DN4385_c0_g1_i2:36-3404(-)
MRKPKRKGGHTTADLGPEFLYNSRLWVAFLPSAAVVLAVGGKIIWGTVVVGLMLSYICDLIGTQAGAFAAAWLTLFVVAIGFFSTGFHLVWSSVFNVFLILNIFVFLSLIGIWVALQFAFLRQIRSLLIALRVGERLLFACFPMVCSVITTWGAVNMSSMETAPYSYLAVLFVNYMAFSLPLVSSFGHRYTPGLAPTTLTAQSSTSLASSFIRGKKTTKEVQTVHPDYYILGPVESGIHTVVFLAGPLVFHCAIYHRALFSGLLNISNFLLVLGLPVVLLRFLLSRGALWWTGVDEAKQRSIQTAFTIASVIMIVACFEYRVIFHAYAHVIPLRPPFNYIFVTFALYGLAGLITLHFIGRIKLFGKRNIQGLAIAAALAASFVLGLEFYFWMFPVGAAYFLVNFYFKRTIKEYFLFVGCASFLVGWYLHHSFWFLKFHFYLSGVSIQIVALLLLLLFVLCLSLPGLVVLNHSPILTSLVLLFHAFVMSQLETVLYIQHLTTLYPAYLTVVTTGMGLYLVRRLEREKKLVPFISWIINCLYVAKLVLLPAVSTYSVLSAWALLLVVTPPFQFYYAVRMTVKQALIHVASIGIVAFMVRNSLIDRIFIYTMYHSASTGLLIALTVALWALSCFRITFHHFAHLSVPRSVNSFVLVAACVFIALQPETGFTTFTGTSGGTVINLMSPFSAASHPASGYALTLPAGWPQYALMVALALTMSAVTIFPVRNSFVWRAVYAVSTGFCLGLFVCGMYVPYHNVLSPLFVTVFIDVVAFVVFTHWPSTTVDRALPYLYAIMMATYVLIYIFAGRFYALMPGVLGREYMKTWRLVVMGVCAISNIFIALFLKFKFSTAVVAQSSSREAALSAQATVTKRQQQLLQQLQRREYEWMARTGNIATVTATCLSLVVNLHYLDGTNSSIFALAPILLLLNVEFPDKYLEYVFGRRGNNPATHRAGGVNRYAPVAMAVTAFLGIRTITAILRIGYLLAFSYISTVTATETWTAFTICKNVAFLAATLPSHYYFVRYTLLAPSSASHTTTTTAATTSTPTTTPHQQRLSHHGKPTTATATIPHALTNRVWLLTPCNLIPAFFGDLTALQLLGATGILQGIFQLYTAHRIRSSGRYTI